MQECYDSQFPFSCLLLGNLWQVEQHFSQFLEKRTTSGVIAKFLKISFQILISGLDILIYPIILGIFG